MRKVALVVILLALPLLCFSEDAATLVEPKDIYADILNKCKEASKVECDSDCVDGFGEDCYFDSVKYKKAELKSGFRLPKETKDTCFAIHSFSRCGKCYYKFELIKNGKLEEVPCEEFYRAIKEKNERCNNCVDVIEAGCC